MSNYTWMGEDIRSFVHDAATTDGNISDFNNYFNNMFIQKNVISSGATATNPDYFTGQDSHPYTLPDVHNTYFCYADIETVDHTGAYKGPPFFIDNENIFSKEFSTTSGTTKRIQVKGFHYDYNTTGTITLPIWCNAIKLYFYSNTGADGSPGAGLAAGSGHHKNQNNDRHNDVQHRNHHKNYDVMGDKRRHNEDKNIFHHDHRHHNEKYTYPARAGGAAGPGGLGKIGWFWRYIIFHPGNQNSQIEFDINKATGYTNKVELNTYNSGVKTTILDFEYSNGSQGGNGTAAYIDQDDGGYMNINTTNNNFNINNYGHNGFTELTDLRQGSGANINIHWNNGDHRNYVSVNNAEHEANESKAGTIGSTGHTGTVNTINYQLGLDIGNYLYYTNANTKSYLSVYCFKHARNDFSNYNPFTWGTGLPNHQPWATSGNFSADSLNTRAHGVTSYAGSDLYWARHNNDHRFYVTGQGGSNNPEVTETDIVGIYDFGLGATSRGWTFYFESTIPVTLEKFDIYLDINPNNIPYYPSELVIFGYNTSTGYTEIYRDQPQLITTIPNDQNDTNGGLNVCNNNRAYTRYYFCIHKIAGQTGGIVSGTTEYDWKGPRINYIHPFIREEI